MSYLDSKTWQESVVLAEHYKAIGETRLHLYHPADPPWHAVTSVKSSGETRYSVSTGLEFTAEIEGLEFHWTFGWEEPDSNGRSGLRADIPRVAAMLTLVPPHLVADVLSILEKAAIATEEQANKSLAFAQQLLGRATALRSLRAPEASS